MFFKKGTFILFPIKDYLGLSPQEQVILAWLYYHADKTGFCWPSHKILCRETGMKSRTSLRRYLKQLEKKKLIKISTRQLINNRYHSITYKINLQNGGQNMTMPKKARSEYDHAHGQNMNMNYTLTEPNKEILKKQEEKIGKDHAKILAKYLPNVFKKLAEEK
jgi:DNA-binding transcriptional regulator LsrR (DeoR family)